MQATLQEHNATYETLTKGQASEIIDGLKPLVHFSLDFDSFFWVATIVAHFLTVFIIKFFPKIM